MTWMVSTTGIGTDTFQCRKMVSKHLSLSKATNSRSSGLVTTLKVWIIYAKHFTVQFGFTFSSITDWPKIWKITKKCICLKKTPCSSKSSHNSFLHLFFTMLLSSFAFSVVTVVSTTVPKRNREKRDPIQKLYCFYSSLKKRHASLNKLDTVSFFQRVF